MTHQCPACSGKRTFTLIESERRYAGGSYTLTGRMVERVYPCNVCKGSGVVRCLRCLDSGYIDEYDYAAGEWEGQYPCDCDAGMRMAELDRIDAEKAAHEAMRVLPDISDLRAMPF